MSQDSQAARILRPLAIFAAGALIGHLLPRLLCQRKSKKRLLPSALQSSDSEGCPDGARCAAAPQVSPTRDPSSVSDAFGWVVFWDFENVPLVQQADGNLVMNRLRSTLGAYRGRAQADPLIEVNVYVNVNKMSVPLRNQLQANGAVVRHVETQGRKDALDKALLIDFCLAARVYQEPPFGLCMVSGDQDFVAAVARLRNLGYTTAVLAPPRSRCSDRLLEAANVCFALADVVGEEQIFSGRRTADKRRKAAPGGRLKSVGDTRAGVEGGGEVSREDGRAERNEKSSSSPAGTEISGASGSAPLEELSDAVAGSDRKSQTIVQSAKVADNLKKSVTGRQLSTKSSADVSEPSVKCTDNLKESVSRKKLGTKSSTDVAGPSSPKLKKSVGGEKPSRKSSMDVPGPSSPKVGNNLKKNAKDKKQSTKSSAGVPGPSSPKIGSNLKKNANDKKQSAKSSTDVSGPSSPKIGSNLKKNANDKKQSAKPSAGVPGPSSPKVGSKSKKNANDKKQSTKSSAGVAGPSSPKAGSKSKKNANDKKQLTKSSAGVPGPSSPKLGNNLKKNANNKKLSTKSSTDMPEPSSPKIAENVKKSISNKKLPTKLSIDLPDASSHKVLERSQGSAMESENSTSREKGKKGSEVGVASTTGIEREIVLELLPSKVSRQLTGGGNAKAPSPRSASEKRSKKTWKKKRPKVADDSGTGDHSEKSSPRPLTVVPDSLPADRSPKSSVTSSLDTGQCESMVSVEVSDALGMEAKGQKSAAKAPINSPGLLSTSVPPALRVVKKCVFKENSTGDDGDSTGGVAGRIGEVSADPNGTLTTDQLRALPGSKAKVYSDDRREEGEEIANGSCVKRNDFSGASSLWRVCCIPSALSVPSCTGNTLRTFFRLPEGLLLRSHGLRVVVVLAMALLSLPQVVDHVFSLATTITLQKLFGGLLALLVLGAWLCFAFAK